MYKENGRSHPADPKEYANEKRKKFKCVDCAAEVLKKDVEFGEKIECPVCGGMMLEEV